MSFGKKKKSNPVPKAVTPQLTTPFGSTTASGSNITYNPTYQPGQQESMGTANTKLAELLKGMNTSTDINQAFDNPFYQTLSQLMTNDLNRQAETSRRNLDARLAARGDLRNSSGIYAAAENERNIGDSIANALLKSRLGAYDAYRQNEQDQLARGQFLQNISAAIQAQALEPLRMYTGVAPIANQVQIANQNAAAQNAQSSGGGGGLFSGLLGAGLKIAGL